MWSLADEPDIDQHNSFEGSLNEEAPLLVITKSRSQYSVLYATAGNLFFLHFLEGGGSSLAPYHCTIRTFATTVKLVVIEEFS
jgi:hypothetical protein